MKLKLYGLEVYEVAKKYPEFTLDSEKFPELELEMEAVAEADRMGDRVATQYALEELYIKMYDTEVKGSWGDENHGLDIMSLVGPFDPKDPDTISEDYSDESAMFRLVGVERDKGNS
tara:strand:- start:273 stop:623 length:351 start_codon:yes stop_codon:yes gene_type:complete